MKTRNVCPNKYLNCKKLMIFLYDQETIKYCPYTSVIENIDPAPHVHTFWEIVYPLYNQALMQYVNEQRADLNGGEFLIIKPNDVHRFVKPEPYVKIRQRNVFVSDEKMRLLCDGLDKGLYDKLVYSTEPIKVPFSRNCMETLEGRWSVFSGDKQDNLNSLHSSLVAYYLGLYIEHGLGDSIKYPEWLIKLLENTKNKEFLTKSISEMIKSTNYSHGFVCRAFKAHVGKTLVQYVLEERLRLSIIMLLDKNKSAVDVALDSGFCSQSSYINAFKKLFGITPAVWRKQNLGVKEIVPNTVWGENTKTIQN